MTAHAPTGPAGRTCLNRRRSGTRATTPRRAASMPPTAIPHRTGLSGAKDRWTSPAAPAGTRKPCCHPSTVIGARVADPRLRRPAAVDVLGDHQNRGDCAVTQRHDPPSPLPFPDDGRRHRRRRGGGGAVLGQDGWMRRPRAPGAPPGCGRLRRGERDLHGTAPSAPGSQTRAGTAGLRKTAPTVVDTDVANDSPSTRTVGPAPHGKVTGSSDGRSGTTRSGVSPGIRRSVTPRPTKVRRNV